APVEQPEDLFWRVARTIAEPDGRYGASAKAVEGLAETFFELMATRIWMPNSPTLMNAGRPRGQLSACFVLPVEDALSNGQSGIYDTLRAMALVHQSGGGTGFSFSRLRPKNDVVRSTMGVASGPVSFMKLYDASTDVVKQGGTRRGANMGILRVDHPDILDFIHCKDDLTQVTNFNISVAVTDAFMVALEAGMAYDLIHPRTGKVVGQLDALDVFRQIVHGAWKTGEPGVFYIDRANTYNPVPHLGSYEATNPCGEQPLLSYDVCNLGSIIAGCSSGIEPLFAVAFMRNQAGVLMPDVNEDFVAIAKREGWYSDALMTQIAEAGHIHFEAVPQKWQKVFVTAHDVTPEWHIQMQGAFQDFTDSAISKTCNFANDATEEYVERIYRYAYQLGCKGVTVYRDGARENQVLSTGSTAKKVQE